MIFQYKKPSLLTEMEKAVLEELQNVVTEDDTEIESRDLFAKLMEVAGGRDDDMEEDVGSLDSGKLNEIRYLN